MKTKIIIGQIISWIFIISLGTILSFEQIPGNRNICDAGQGEYGIAWLIFIIAVLSLIINSWFHSKKNHLKNYRKYAIIAGFLVLVTSFFIRALVFQVFFGKEKYSYEHLGYSIPLVDLKLYENKKFYSLTYDFGCHIENIGTYTKNNKTLNLEFDGQHSKYLGTKYRIEGNHIICLNCNEYLRLRLKR